MSIGFKELVRRAVSWQFAMTALAVAAAFEFVILAVGLVGHVREAERDAGKAATAISVPRKSAPVRHAPEASGAASAPELRPVQSPMNISATGSAPLQPRSLDEILGAEGGKPHAGPDVASTPVTHVEEDKEPGAEGGDGAELSSESVRELVRLVKEARVAHIAGDMRQCILKLEAASAINPKHPAVLYFFGMAYEALKNVDKAREYYMQVFLLREKAGQFFDKAAFRLKNGFETPASMRGKMAFGPCQVTRKAGAGDGETVVLHLPVLLAPDEEINPKDVDIKVQFFDLVNGRDIALTRADASIRFLNESANWADGEEVLEIVYHMPVLTDEEFAAYGELTYYGYAVRLYYQGELLDCEGSPRSLVLVEQRLQSTSPNAAEAGDGDFFSTGEEEAVPVSDYIDEQATE